MSVRMWIKTHPAAAAGASLGLALVAMGLFVWPAVSGNGSGTAAPTQAFYSVDDGKSYFVDDADLLSGFDHQGQPAYRVYVFDTRAGEPFVGYLERLAPEVRAGIKADADAPARARIQSSASELEVKKPGERKWHARTSPEGAKAVRITPPDGDIETLEVVIP